MNSFKVVLSLVAIEDTERTKKTKTIPFKIQKTKYNTGKSKNIIGL